MKNLTLTKLGILLLSLALTSHVDAQNSFNRYGPVAGIQKSTGTTPYNTAAVAADIYGLWSGTCSASTFLNGAGACSVPPGTGISFSAPAIFTVTGSPGTSISLSFASGQAANQILATPNGTTGAVGLRALVAGDLPPINLGSTANGGVSSSSILLGTNGGTSNAFFSVTGPTTSLKTFTFPNASATVLTTNTSVTVPQGGTGLATLTANGVMLGEGTASPNFIVMGADTVLRGTASADPIATSVNNCGDATHALSYSTSTHTFGCQTITSGGTGTVTSVTAGSGLTASPNPVVSSGTVSLDLTANDTWTGTHTFTPSGTSPAITINHNSGASTDFSMSGSSGQIVTSKILTTTTTGFIQDLWTTSGTSLNLLVCTASAVSCTPAITGGPSGVQAAFYTGAQPIVFGTNNTARMQIASGGRITLNAASADNTLVVNGAAGSSLYGITTTSPNTASNSFGLHVVAGTNSSDRALDVQGANGSSTRLLSLDGAGVLSLPSNYSSAGTVSTTAGGVFTTSSDLRLKRDIGPFTKGLSEVMQLHPIYYRWKESSGLDDRNHTLYAGFGAQDVLSVIPEAVGIRSDGYYTLSDRPIIGALVNSIQKQQLEIETLQFVVFSLLAIFVVKFIIRIKTKNYRG